MENPLEIILTLGDFLLYNMSMETIKRLIRRFRPRHAYVLGILAAVEAHAEFDREHRAW